MRFTIIARDCTSYAICGQTSESKTGSYYFLATQRSTSGAICGRQTQRQTGCSPNRCSRDFETEQVSPVTSNLILSKQEGNDTTAFSGEQAPKVSSSLSAHLKNRILFAYPFLTRKIYALRKRSSKALLTPFSGSLIEGFVFSGVDRKYHILKFLRDLLDDPDERFRSVIKWEDRPLGVFKILEPSLVASLWGDKKKIQNMNYDKMSRALRYYYKANVLSKCGRLCYRFNWENVRPDRMVLIKEEQGKYKITIKQEGVTFNSLIKDEKVKSETSIEDSELRSQV